MKTLNELVIDISYDHERHDEHEQKYLHIPQEVWDELKSRILDQQKEVIIVAAGLASMIHEEGATGIIQRRAQSLCLRLRRTVFCE